MLHVLTHSVPTRRSSDLDPTKAVRPFDATRNGFILGEGAGVLILEELEHAQARGARIYAEWRAAGTSNDAYDMFAAAEDGHGIADAMRLAMSRDRKSTRLNSSH